MCVLNRLLIFLSTVGCLTKNIKIDFQVGSARLGNIKLLLNCRKKKQPDFIRFQTSKESSMDGDARGPLFGPNVLP
jgi:hypothetical protein